MKTKSLPAVLFALALLLACVAPRASAQITLQAMFSDLAPYGQWTQLGSYGTAWQPNISDPDWAPYSEGHWVYTDYGWTWVSDEPWGWATYHYGRWVDLDQGWFWIPGTQWAPAWVSWRFGGGYCGWVPLPPHGHPFPPRGYLFVRVGSLGSPSLRGAYLDRSQSATYVHLTAHVGGVTAGANGLRHLNGPPLAAVNAASPHPVQHLQLQIGTQAGASHNSAVVGNTLHVYAPHITPGAAHPPAAGGAPFHPAAANPPSPSFHPAAAAAPAPQPAPVHSFSAAPAAPSGYHDYQAASHPGAPAYHSPNTTPSYHFAPAPAPQHASAPSAPPSHPSGGGGAPPHPSSGGGGQAPKKPGQH